MNTSNKVQEIKNRFNAAHKKKTEEQKIRHDEYMLMASFLSEIEEVQKQKDFKRNKLADLIKTSASYLTQVFRGDKPLNFHTIAKIQKALDIRFTVTAHPKKKLTENSKYIALEVKSKQFIKTLPLDLNIQESPLSTLPTVGITEGTTMYMIINSNEKKLSPLNS